MNADPLIKLLPFDVSKVRAQDVVVVLAVFAAVFLFRAPNVWELKPSWQLGSTSEIHHKPGKNQLPVPLITDLDSDGINEVILATEDGRLQIHMLPPQEDHEPSFTLPHLHMKKEVVLKSNSSQSALPVALGAGCDHRRLSSLDVCRQIIVVVTDDGVVHCFTDQLEQLWMTVVFKDDKELQSMYFREIAVRIVPYSPDHGLVLIGGKVAKEDPFKDHHLEHDHQHNMSAGLSADEIAKLPPRRLRHTKTTFEEKEHFSTYALNSKTGATHWKHEPGDYEATKNSREDILSAYHFKLALHSSQYHVGEVHWSYYTESLITSMPYRWQHPADTKIQTAHFVKKMPSSAARTPNRTPSVRHETHSKQELSRERQPNVVVIHRQKSIEVLSLDSGKPLCTYTVSKDTTSAGDINGDNVIEHATMYFSSEPRVQAEINPCSAVVTSGARTLFTGSICRPTSSFGRYFDSSAEEDFREEPVPVAPLLVDSPLDRSGIFSHLSGDKVKRESIRGYDSVFIISSGRLTSFGPYGEFNWQVDTEASWLNYDRKETNPRKADFVPNIQAVTTSVGGVKDAVLVTGRSRLVLVSLKDGSLLASHSIPCEPLSPVAHGDFTNDGLMDFVVHCRASYLGFSLDSRPGFWWTAVWVACGLGAIGIAVLILRFIEEVIA